MILVFRVERKRLPCANHYHDIFEQRHLDVVVEDPLPFDHTTSYTELDAPVAPSFHQQLVGTAA